MKNNSVGIAVLTSLVGQDNAETFVSHFGGREYRFPEKSNCKQATRLRQLLGDESANKLLDYFAGDKPYIRTEKIYFTSLRNKKFIGEFYELIDNGIKKTTALYILCPKYGFTKRWGDELIRMHEELDKKLADLTSENHTDNGNKTR